MAMSKTFVIGLPRSGTTSVCAAALDLGLRTAHTAYTKACFERAELIADTPCFSHYSELAERFPEAKFVLLQRQPERWLESIQRLLQRMSTNLLSDTGGFSPLLKASYHRVFSPLNEQSLIDGKHLEYCYKRHQQQVSTYFAQQAHRLLTIDISESHSFQQFCQFVGANSTSKQFAHLNQHNKVMAWRDIKHPLKVPSTRNGKVDNLEAWLGGEAV